MRRGPGEGLSFLYGPAMKTPVRRRKEGEDL
jgi:hypothetical protein